MNIVVLAGGWSPEREVSLSSGSLIANALSNLGHRVLLLDAYLGAPLERDALSYFRSDVVYSHRVGTEIPDLAALKRTSGNGDALLGPNVLSFCRAADVVYNALHGDMGEDGTLQGCLDSFGIRYTGTGAIGAMLAMDKDLSKRILRAAGLATPDWITLTLAGEPDPRGRILREIGLPCVIKPCSCGSSVGISIVETEEELDRAISFAAAYEETILVEKKILGRELTCGILDGKSLPPIEIIPKEGFYDYKNKYQSGLTTELCPAPLSPEDEVTVREASERGFDALRLRCYARFDFILDRDGVAWVLEANSLPGMTPTSLLPQMAATVGMSYENLCQKIVDLAFLKK